MRSTAALSLIELLIVTAIIAMLGSLLLPTITLVKEAAYTMRCRSSMRQLAIGVLALAGDRRGALPGATGLTYPLDPTAGMVTYNARFEYSDNQAFDPDPSSTGYRKNSWWPVQLAEFVDEDPMRQTRTTRRANSATFGCPVWRQRVDRNLVKFDSPNWKECHPGYGMPVAVRNAIGDTSDRALAASNYSTYMISTAIRAIGWDSSSTFTARVASSMKRDSTGCSMVLLSQLSTPARTPWITETANHVAIDNRWDWDAPDNRHRGTANAAFLDGHVKALSSPTVLNTQSKMVSVAWEYGTKAPSNQRIED